MQIDNGYKNKVFESLHVLQEKESEDCDKEKSQGFTEDTRGQTTEQGSVEDGALDKLIEGLRNVSEAAKAIVDLLSERVPRYSDSDEDRDEDENKAEKK